MLPDKKYTRLNQDSPNQRDSGLLNASAPNGHNTMSHDRDSRISAALNTLVNILVPDLDGEDPAEADERQENALELAKGLLDR